MRSPPQRPSASDIVRAMLEGKFKPMTEHDMQGWQGIEEDGWECVINDHHVVIGTGIEVMVNVVAPDGMCHVAELANMASVDMDLEKGAGKIF